MSLEYHIKNGIILPIGHLVCSFCKDKQLKDIDTLSSQVVTCDANSSVSVRSMPLHNLKRPASLDLSNDTAHHHQVPTYQGPML
jgi:hypothetical protein